MNSNRSIAILLFDNVNAVDVTGPIEVFASARSVDGSSAYSINSWSIDETQVKTESGLCLMADSKIPNQASTDILIVPGGAGIREKKTLNKISRWLRENHTHFGELLSICTGAYALAEAGLVDGYTVTTHWAHANDLQKRYPAINVDSGALFLRGQHISSSGGVTAGIDLALDIVQDDLGERAAMNAARELVVFLRRQGTQAQFSLPLQMQSKAHNRLSEVCHWAAANLQSDLSVETLAERAGLSPRQFARKFQDELGTSPGAYIKCLRLDTGRTLLSQGVTITRVTHSVGFRTTNGFRRAFEKNFGVNPSEYQNHFRRRNTQ